LKTTPFILATLVALSCQLKLNAQADDCGTVLPQDVLEHFSNTSEARSSFNVNFRSTRYLPLRFHVVRYSNGSGGLSNNDMVEQLQILNQRYRSSSIQFFLCGPPNHIDNDHFADYNVSMEHDLATANDQPGALNVYFVPKIQGSDGSSLCGYSYFYNRLLTEQSDRVFVQSGCAKNGSTLAHEIGHYLSLLHTHSTSHGPSLVNDANCNSNGDQLCDTPADPNLVGLVNSSCSYTGSARDVSGDLYAPSTDNVMSYAPAQCRTEFTGEQLNRIMYSAQFERNYLACADTFHLHYVAEQTELPVRVYPNPASHIAQVSIEEIEDGDFFKVSLYNLRGEPVYTAMRDRDERSQPIDIDLTAFDKGIYLVAVSNGIKSRSQKLIYQ